jgi:hypothetical protein
VSFRGGGDKAFHAALKRVLIAKAWVVDLPTAKAAHAGGSKSGLRTFFCEPPSRLQTDPRDPRRRHR